MTRETVSAGGANYNSLGLFVGPVNHTDVVRVDVSGLTTDEVDTDGYLKPGTPFRSNGVLLSRRAGLYSTVIAGGAAGAHTVTGILAGDRLVSVVRVDLDATAANIDADVLTSEFTITDTDEITNDTTNTTGDKLIVTYEALGEYVFGVTMEPVQVAQGNTTTLLNAATDIDVAVARMGVVNRDAAEDNLGRAYTAIELAAFDAAGSHLALTRT